MQKMWSRLHGRQEIKVVCGLCLRLRKTNRLPDIILEQDADTVMFIYGKGQVKLGKNRHGAEGKLTMNFNKPISKFTQQ